jgi:hypothetical protein
MNKFQIFTLKTLRKVFQIIFKPEINKTLECINDADVASKIIFDALTSDEPCMISRFGSTELACLTNYVGVIQSKHKYLSYILGKTPLWWWEKKVIDQMKNWSGFFPPTQKKIEQFCRLMLEDIPQVDILGSWLSQEAYFSSYLKDSTKVSLMYIDPYWANTPWTSALKGKKILIVHPFANTIEKQYKKRELLFNDKNFIPKFKSLTTIKAVQSLGDSKTKFNDWFEALEFMKSEINRVDYDICLLGCGAYGLPLAAHVKRSGKKAFHIGGSLQLLFGIKGKRWELLNDQRNVTRNEISLNYFDLPNQHWVRPSKEEKPENASLIEGGCYW